MITEQKIREWLSLSNQNEAARHEVLSLLEFCQRSDLEIAKKILQSETVELALRTLKRYVQDMLICISNGDYSLHAAPVVRDGVNSFKGIRLTPVQAINIFLFEDRMVAKADRLQTLLNQRGKVEYEQSAYIQLEVIKEVEAVRQSRSGCHIMVTPDGYLWKAQELFRFAEPIGGALKFMYEYQPGRIFPLLNKHYHTLTRKAGHYVIV